jgi:hypothetical protein
MRVKTGQVSFVSRLSELQEAATILPRFASDLQIMCLKRQTGPATPLTHKAYVIRRHKVWAALLWLVAHNPAFKNIEISAERLALLPEDGHLSPPTVITFNDENDVDMGPAPFQTVPPTAAPLPHPQHSQPTAPTPVQPTAAPLPHSQPTVPTVPTPVQPTPAPLPRQQPGQPTTTTQVPSSTTPPEEPTFEYSGIRFDSIVDPTSLASRVQSELQAAVGNNTPAPDPVVYHNYTNSYISWKSDPNFFCGAWPHKFYGCVTQQHDTVSGIVDTGSGFERSGVRQQQYTFTEWVEYLINHFSGRYSSDPSLVFALQDIKHREQGFQSTSFGIQQAPDVEMITLAQLREMLVPGEHYDPSRVLQMGCKINSWVRNVTGSAAYWQTRQKDVAALVRDRMFFKNDLPVFFHSGSCAEYHSRELHRILQQVLLVRGDENDARICGYLARGGTVPSADLPRLRLLINDNMVIVNAVFVARTKSWFDNVIRDGLGINTYWYR